MGSLTIVRAGMLTTIQDLGRWGYQHHGVPVAGPMDPYSHRLANHLVGNPADRAALEITLIGPEIESNAEVVCAVTGAEFAVTVGGQPVTMNTRFVVKRGTRLRFGSRSRGARATLAVAGGIMVPPLFGSRATSLVSQMGPLGGRALVAGDVLQVGHARPRDSGTVAARVLALPLGGVRLRVIVGPHQDMFTTSALDVLFSSRYVVTSQSNRMGYRLDGPPLAHAGRADILSEATPIGSLQVPASGQPILLMADRQTTGGYPKIATVITADLAVAGQLAPGDWVEFAACTRKAAMAALRHQEERLTGREQ